MSRILPFRKGMHESAGGVCGVGQGVAGGAALAAGGAEDRAYWVAVLEKRGAREDMGRLPV